MPRFFVGVDTSKGYADLHLMNEAETMLQGTGRYDDTPSGHESVRKALASLVQQHPQAEFTIGIEASGGLERNWLRFFQSFTAATSGAKRRLYQLNPLAVKKFLELDLHRNATDAASAKGIAKYLKAGLRPQDAPFEAHLEGPRALYRFTRNLIQRSTTVQNELQSLLPSVHPSLVAYCREGLPRWVLMLLLKHPTVETLKRARSATLARLPYITADRAESLIAAAKTSVASLRDTDTALVVRSLADEALRLDAQITSLKRQLIARMESDPEVKILVSIPGIGAWTATCIRLQCGSLARFHSDNALVAFSGLDPRIDKSGDGEIRKSISRRGHGDVRAALYMAVKAAIRFNPPIAAFYARLIANGKTHKQAATACMAKLLRIGYACVLTGQDFDPHQHEVVRKRHEELQATSSANTQKATESTVATENDAIDAPITWREAKRRRAAAMPQMGSTQQERGPGAALNRNDTTPNNEQQSSHVPLTDNP